MGVWHPSGHAYNFEYWDPLDEEDQRFSPQDLTALYDACVHPSGRSLPMKFMGPTLSDTAILAQFVAYFFDPKNHHAEVPVDIVPITSTLFRIGRDPGNHAAHKLTARLTGY